jgi:hypothetical protein
MIFTRRIVLTSALCAPALLLSGRRPSAYVAENEITGVAPTFEGTPSGKAPGDYGFKHQRYHASYKRLFGEIGNCLCGDGECRTTDWRESKESPMGYAVIVCRKWIPLPADTWMPTKGSEIPLDLFAERAHVCAYGTYDMPVIACALINATQT